VLGFKDLEDFMVNFWEAWALSKGKPADYPFHSPSRETHRRERREGNGEKPMITLPWLYSFRSDLFYLPTSEQPDPENMLTMLHTWQTGDVSKQEPYNGDFSAAMKGIKAKTLVLPSKTDLYFRKYRLFLFFFFGGLERCEEKRRERREEWSPLCESSVTDNDCTAPEDSEIEVENMRPGIGEMRAFPSIWGHWAGGKLLRVFPLLESRIVIANGWMNQVLVTARTMSSGLTTSSESSSRRTDRPFPSEFRASAHPRS
jgi:hypothetical protein